MKRGLYWFLGGDCYHPSVSLRSTAYGLPLPEFSADLGAALENSDGCPSNLSLNPPQAVVKIAALTKGSLDRERPCDGGEICVQ